MTNNLAACPFCGSDTCQTREVRWNPVMTKWAVSCIRGCEADGPAHDTEAEAIAAWNQRTPQAGDRELARGLATMATGLRGSMWANRNEIIDLLDRAASRLTTPSTTGNEQLRALGLELSEDGYSLRTPYDGDVDGDGRHIVVGGETVVTFADSDEGEKARDALLAALSSSGVSEQDAGGVS